jgi:hypothetical protein
MVPPDSLRISRVRRYSGTPRSLFGFRVRGYHPVLPAFPDRSTSFSSPLMRVLQPRPTSGTVWAIPRSLAATYGVSFDFLSFGYLDVSVPRVGSLAGNQVQT